MRFLTKRILSMVLVLCLCLAMLPTVTMKVEAATPDYAVSSSYKASSYYTALCNVTLTGNQREDIVNVALSQVGYREGSSSDDYSGADDGSYNNYTEFNYWYHNYVSSGMPVGGDSAPWCATFVSWCAEQANIPTSILKRSTAAGHGASYFNVNFYSGSSTLASSSDNDSYFMGYNYTPQIGDLFFTRSWSHVGLVVAVNGSYVITVEGNTNTNGSSQGNGVYKLTTRQISDLYFGVPNYTGGTSHTCNKGTYVYYEAAHPHYKCYECSICGSVWRNTQEPTIVSSCSSCVSPKTIDDRYSSYFPIGAYPISTGHISVYDATGTVYSNRYIDGATDICIIWEIYTDGWCKVRYPSSAEESGYFDAYVPLSIFTTASSPSSWTVTNDYTTYKRSDLDSIMHNVSSGANCLLLDTNGSVKQIIHPVSGQTYSMMGWINDPKEIHISVDSVNLILGGTESQVIYAWSTGSYGGNTALYFSRSNSNVSCSWGDWTNGKAPLTITANAMGTTTLTVGVKDSDSGTVLDSTTVTVTITAKTYTVSYNANGGSGAPGSQTKYHNTTLTLSSTKPARTGYTFLGWSTSSSATSASYQPGGSFSVNSNAILYAVWEKGCENNSHNYSYEVTKAPTTSASGTLTGTCSNCSGTTTVTLPKLNTTDYTYKVTKEPSYTATGIGTYTWNTTTYGTFYFDVTLDKLSDSNAPQIVIENVTGTAGETVSISVYLENNPGVAYAKFKVNYSEELTLVSAEDQSVLSGTFTTSKTVDVKPYVLQWMGADNSTKNGCFVILTFQIAEDVEDGIYDITLTCSEAYNEAYEDVTFAITNASITVTSHIPGDVNGDGKVNGKDGVLLAQYLAEWDVTINMDAADVNGDGKVNGKDGVLLAQYLAA
ncbi:MAG: InlB B-repeat-containing protein [Oscillospiraceae bacterium]|nr:InlB B-repeat-containing protein [Oscillospiraceae bacterium]